MCIYKFYIYLIYLKIVPQDIIFADGYEYNYIFILKYDVCNYDDIDNNDEDVEYDDVDDDDDAETVNL